MNQLDDLREWLVSKIDGAIESYGEDSLISSFINQIDAQDAQLVWARKEKEKEIETLRRYGNKDCTAQADEALYSPLPLSETTPIPQSKTQQKLFAAQMEPHGCPTPGACSCPGTTPFEIRKKIMTAHMLAESIVERATVATPRTDAATVRMERLDGDIDEVVSADFARTLERELIDLKQRLLPQYLGRAERAERENADLRHDIERLTASLTAEVNAPRSATAEPKPVDAEAIVAACCELFDCRPSDLRSKIVELQRTAAQVEETAKSCIRVVPI